MHEEHVSVGNRLAIQPTCSTPSQWRSQDFSTGGGGGGGKARKVGRVGIQIRVSKLHFCTLKVLGKSVGG